METKKDILNILFDTCVNIGPIRRDYNCIVSVLYCLNRSTYEDYS